MTSTALPPGATEPGPPGALAQAIALVDAAAETLWVARAPRELTATVEALAQMRARLDALELSVVQELQTGPGGEVALKEAGWASVKDYLTHAAGGRKGYGPATARLAGELHDLPELMEALATGRLSRVKAQIIATATKKLPVDPEVREKALRVLLDEASRLGADDLERAGRHVLEVIDPDGVDAALERELERTERAAHLNRNVVMKFDQLGGGSGRFCGSAEDVELLKVALLSLAAPEPSAPGACGGDGVCTDRGCMADGHSGRDPRDHGTRMFDALVQLARMAQATGALPDCHGGVPHIGVTMDFDDLKRGVVKATTTLGDDLTAGTVRRLACDADIIPGVLGADGAILDVGRAQRLVTAAIWVALVIRDTHCAFPGCRRPPVMCHAHHVIHWIDGGGTCLDNLVLLCGTHHRIVHASPWRVRLSPRDRRPEFQAPHEDAWRRDRGGGRADPET